VPALRQRACEICAHFNLGSRSFCPSFYRGDFINGAAMSPENAMQDHFDRMEDMRENMIWEEIGACTECDRDGFHKDPNCESCIAAVDERIAAMAHEVQQ